MKKKSRKITWREFRYLSKGQFNNHLLTLKKFSEDKRNCSKNFLHFINMCLCKDIRCKDFNSTHTYLELGKAIDLAWLIFNKSGLKRKNKKDILPNHSDEIDCSCNYNLGAHSPDFLTKMFSCQSHRDWHTAIDELLFSYLDPSFSCTFLSYSEDLIPLQETLSNLPIVLRTIHLNEGKIDK